jgi:hypothetical protein
MLAPWAGKPQTQLGCGLAAAAAGAGLRVLFGGCTLFKMLLLLLL